MSRSGRLAATASAGSARGDLSSSPAFARSTPASVWLRFSTRGLISNETRTGQQAEGFEVLVGRSAHDCFGQLGAGRLLVEMYLLEVVPHVLFVERGLRSARPVFRARPEPRGIGR